jgi:hypothetical protein
MCPASRCVLLEQIGLLESLPGDFARVLPRPALFGPCFGSFWVVQLLFQPDGQVAALVDWTDGAEESDFWADDIVTGIHLSALSLDTIAAYAAGYQTEHPLPESEWRAVTAKLCYGHLASNNFWGGWLTQSYRRLARLGANRRTLASPRAGTFPQVERDRGEHFARDQIIGWNCYCALVDRSSAIRLLAVSSACLNAVLMSVILPAYKL